MLTAIVTHESTHINPFDLLTSDGFDKLNPAERADQEAAAGSEQANAGTRNPLPEDLRISYLELTEQDLLKEARSYDVDLPVDDLLKLAQDATLWHRIFSGWQNVSEVIEHVSQLPLERRAKFIAQGMEMNRAQASIIRMEAAYLAEVRSCD